MRRCIDDCGFEGPEESYPPVGRGKRSTRCRMCKRKYDNNHYHTRRDKKRKQELATKRAQATKRKLADYLQGKECSDCGNSNLIVLEFDHREGEDKKGNIADLVSSLSFDSLMLEINKCDIVCANCHRIRTWQRAGGSYKMPV